MIHFKQSVLSIAAGVTLAFGAAGAQAAITGSTVYPGGSTDVTNISGVSSPGQYLVLGSTVLDTVYNTTDLLNGSDVTTFNIGFAANSFGGLWDLSYSSGGGQTAPGFPDSGSLRVDFFNGASNVGTACINGGNSVYGTCAGLSYTNNFTLGGTDNESGLLVFNNTSSFNKVVVSYAGLGAGGGVRETYLLSGAAAYVNAVPEPETYAMMLAGLGAIGFMARRRRSN